MHLYYPILHWTERAMSERVFASGWNSKSCPAVEGKTGKCDDIVYTEGTELPADTSAIGY